MRQEVARWCVRHFISCLVLDGEVMHYIVFIFIYIIVELILFGKLNNY